MEERRQTSLLWSVDEKTPRIPVTCICWLALLPKKHRPSEIEALPEPVLIDVPKPQLYQEPKLIRFEPATSFSCDGRQYCSQMRSRAEAEYFLKNCPNTKMDGDNDGIPCENDSRF